ncbi:ANTAR domain-containing protein [Streptomyces sp. NPDC087859]|uniref:ANTAR domain-containing protein n=1 Tax=Streptomyces sp. NPDC087859 TaxID=3365812 RepID=UPI003801EF33
MSPTGHEHSAAPALLALVDAPLRGDDDEHLLSRLARTVTGLPGVEAAGCNLLDTDGRPALTAATHDSADRLERAQSELLEGPCLDSARTNKALVNVPMAHPHSRCRWPRYTQRVLQAGFTAVTSLPIRHEVGVTGSLSLYHQREPLREEDVEWSRLLASATAISLAHRNTLLRAQTRERQLQAALDSRVLIEQAKGLLAERFDCTVDDAFDLLRHHARTHQVKLFDLARQIVDNRATGGPFPRKRD